MNLIEKLNELDLQLPEPSNPGGNYVSVNMRGNVAYVAVQFPIFNGEFRYQGYLGNDLTTEDGYQAMQLCALNVISQINAKVGFERVIGLNHLDAYYLSSGDWDDSPKVVNGASDLFVKVLGEKGTHSRAIFGVARLPRNFCVGLTCSFTIESD